MRRRPAASLAALLVALVATPGCFLDEIDKSVQGSQGGKKPPAAAGAAAKAPAAAGQAAGAPAAPAGPSWWQTARTLGSEAMDESIAGCQLGGRVEFMLRDDCLARGGQPEQR
jgi:hypothetical protein